MMRRAKSDLWVVGANSRPNNKRNPAMSTDIDIRTLNDKHRRLIEIEMDPAFVNLTSGEKAIEAGMSTEEYDELWDDQDFCDAAAAAADHSKPRLTLETIASLRRNVRMGKDVRTAFEYLEKIQNVRESHLHVYGETLSARLEALGQRRLQSEFREGTSFSLDELPSLDTGIVRRD